MGLNNATVVVVLKNSNYDESFYVKQIVNLDSTLGNEKSFTDFLITSEMYTSKKDALLYAKEIEGQHTTEHGVLIYDGLDRFSLGEAIMHVGRKNDRALFQKRL